MKNIFKNKSIDINGTDFLAIIKRRAEAKDYFPILENDIKNISKTKEITLNNSQEIFTYCVYSEENHKHYYEGLKTFISNGMCPDCAVDIIENEINENEKMLSFLEEYFEYEFTIDGMIKVDWNNEELGEGNE